MEHQLEIDQINVHLANRHIVKNMSFTLAEGEIGCLLGPSGCGKTTMLRTIAGFQAPSSGRVLIAGNEVCGKANEKPEDRHIGMVFQDLALFPHMTVRKNIGFGMRNARKKEINQS